MILETKLLKEALRSVAAVVTKNPIVPILSHVVIEVKGNEMKVKATNLDETIELSYTTTESNEELVILPVFEDLQNLVENLNHVEIELTQDETRTIHIKTGKIKSKIAGEDIKTFPLTKEVNGEPLEVPGEIFQEMKQRMLPFASTDFIHQMNKTGVNMKSVDGKLIMDASNTKDFARVVLDSETKIDREVNFRSEVVRVGASLFSNGVVYLTINETHAILEQENTKLTARLIEERFPDVDQYLNTLKDPKVFKVDRKLFINEIRRAAKFANEKTKQATFDFRPDRIKILACELDFGKEYSGEIEAEGSGEFIISLNAGVLEKGAALMQGEEVEIFHYEDKMKPAGIRDENYCVQTSPYAS